MASLQQKIPHVVITDYRLGGDMNGLDVLKSVRRMSTWTQGILITAHGDEQIARDALIEGGAYDYIKKPLDLDHLRDVVNRAARQAFTLRENQAMREQLDKAYSFEGIIAVSPADEGGARSRSPRGQQQAHCAHLRRERHRQGAGRPGHS